MAVKQRKPRRVRGSEMRKLGEHLQKRLRAQIRLGTKLGREVRKLERQLVEAEWLIKELETHEGAEGWSEYLRKRLDAYQYQTKGTTL